MNFTSNRGFPQPDGLSYQGEDRTMSWSKRHISDIKIATLQGTQVKKSF